ncbi:MAG: outer membrane protein OmpA-like peptidoglycan-associated protein [Bradymonadia bacterium]|jgi:outer membrane protein OmpA-like peptidoglycan-associated protein
MVRPEATLANLAVDDVITFGAGVGIPIGSVELIVEAIGSASALVEDIAEEEIPLEALIGARYLADSGLNVSYGVGFGILAGFGAPDWRAFLGLGYEKSGCTDCDDDGIINLQDECPNQAEDFDEFEDHDGCPELDNDGDGLNDTSDDCPLDPEDADGFQDEDGCNDPDNDANGILDTNDSCPDHAEDFDEYNDEDGCDDPDNDSDGVLDRDDQCPNDAEDVDGYSDEDGCPEPDNDGDGLLDEEDSCPLDPEDFDGFEDSDGCPEEGEGLVQLTCEQIEIQESVEFSSGSDESEEESFDLLNQVAQVLTTASYIRRVRVEGHTDDRGGDDSNLDLSQRRAHAVRDYLIAAGVTQTIDAQGFGEEMPIADNDERTGRRMNRRVEFHVVERDSQCE